MLTITIPASDGNWDEINQVFTEPTKETTISLEHSLISISKWEEKYKKPFLGDGSEKYINKTPEELFDYIKCMTIVPKGAPPIDDSVYDNITSENLREITDYMQDPHTATEVTYHNKKSLKKPEILTSEVIYANMTILNIPSKYERWHINRLLTLIEVTAIKSDPNPKKMSRSEILSQNKAINELRRAKHHSKG